MRRAVARELVASAVFFLAGLTVSGCLLVMAYLMAIGGVALRGAFAGGGLLTGLLSQWAAQRWGGRSVATALGFSAFFAVVFLAAIGRTDFYLVALGDGLVSFGACLGGAWLGRRRFSATTR